MLRTGRTELHNPIEYAAGLTTAATDEPLSRAPHPHPLTDIATGFGVLGAVFVAVAVAGWAIVQIARGAGWVS